MTLPIAMRNNHRPPTPRGVCLSGHSVRCPACKRPGALEGMRYGQPIALCAACGNGYGRENISATGGGKMVTKKKDAETLDQKNFKAKMKKARLDRGLSWADMDRLLDEKRLDVMCAPSSRPTTSRMIEITRKLERLDDVHDFDDSERVAARTQACEVGVASEPKIEPGRVEACPPYITVDAGGLDADQVKSLAQACRRMAVAMTLGLDVTMHIESGDFSL